MKTAVIVAVAALSSSLPADESSTSLRLAFESHCIRCHGTDGKNEGDVNLRELVPEEDLPDRPELLDSLIAVLADQRMPPEDEPPLPALTRERMVTQLQAMFDRVSSTQAFAPTPIRRMNRFQYNNAVVDLLELDRDIFRLNERMLRRRDDYFRPETGTMPAEVRVSSRPLAKDVDNQRPEGFRGVAAFPQDKRAEHGFDNRADHLTLSPLLMESFLQLSQSIAESPDLNPQECRSWDRLFAPPGQSVRGAMAGRFEAEHEDSIRFAPPAKGHAAPQDMRAFGNQWSGHAQLFWQCSEPGAEIALSFEAGTAGEGLRLAFTRAPDYGTFEVYLDDQLIGDAIDLHYAKVRRLEYEVADQLITAGPHILKFRCVGKNDRSSNFCFGLDCLHVTQSESAWNAELTTAELRNEIRTRLETLLRRAFRRPVEAETLERFATFADRQLTSGAAFEDTMRTVVGAVLGMPDFLYFYESPNSDNPDPGDSGRQPLSDFELAARLARFLWSSIPDDGLLDLAAAGQLSDQHTLGEQIERMLNDRRSSRFCDNFPGQWLQLDRLITSIPDREKFPYFYYAGYRTSIHMMSEPLLLFDTVYIENRSVMDLLDPKFTWQSDMLRANYDGHSDARKQVQVQVFRRVPLDDRRRGGVITNAAVMTMTSTPTRTQPITRGAWVNSVIFNDPPKPPPADVPPLPEADAEELAKLTIRERLAVHRQRADCAGCHNKIDPLGFALENYGPTGVWRDTYENGREVDVSGTLFNRYEFSTVVEFKRLIMEEKQRFIRGFVSHLLSYALGRELGPADAAAVDDITSKAAAGQDQLRTILRSVAMSEPFLHKNVQIPADPVRQSSN